MKHKVIYVATHPSLIRNVPFLSLINKEIQTSQRSEVKCYTTGHLAQNMQTDYTCIYIYLYIYLPVLLGSNYHSSRSEYFTEQRMLQLKNMSFEIRALFEYKML